MRISDWSSDVCSSDLLTVAAGGAAMAWDRTCVMDQRMQFVAACLEGVESLSALSRQYGISRQAGDKWLRRYRAEGPAGLHDRSRRPHRSEEHTSELQSLMRILYAVFCLNKKKKNKSSTA